MKDDLPERAQLLYDRFKAFPEARFEPEHAGGGAVLKRDAYVAFLDMRQLYETEIAAALHELKTLQARERG